MINAHKIKQDICEIGRRIYTKGFAAANDGNISVRISEDQVLCTPTGHSKGFLKPEDICTIDMTGKQIAGIKKRSSEALLHLEIYKSRQDVKSVVHCHPPHATAFAVAREPIPQRRGGRKGLLVDRNPRCLLPYPDALTQSGKRSAFLGRPGT